MSREIREALDRHSLTVENSRGFLYRFSPATGAAARLERHGRRWCEVKGFDSRATEGLVSVAPASLSQVLLLLGES